MLGRGLYIGRDLSKISPSRGGFFIGRFRGVEEGVPVISRIEVSPSVITLDANDRQKFTATAYDQFDQPINSGVSFQWSTTDAEVAVVDSGGLVEAYAGGSVDIVAAANGVTGTAALVVEGEVADVVAKYDIILDLSPDVSVLLQLPRYRGQDMLFTDSGGLLPVEEPGDPIGAVRGPDGSIVATAPAAVNRPLWQGVEEGGYFDGVSDTLYAPDASTKAESYTIATRAAVFGTTTGYLFGFGPARGAVRTITSGTRYNARYMHAGTAPTVSAGEFGEVGVLIGIFGTGPELTGHCVRYNANEACADDEIVPDEQVGLYVGSAETSPKEMRSEWILFVNRLLSEAEMATLEALND